MLKSIRVGVVGCGHLGRFHAQLYTGLAGVELVGVHDCLEDTAKQVAVKHKCRSFGSMEELCREVDALSIATPAVTHYEIVKQALKLDCHVLVEKPITHQSGQARELIQQAKAKDLHFFVGHVERFNAAFQRLAEEHPAPRFLEVHRLTAFGQRGTDVDVVLDLMIHDIDLVFCVVGAPLCGVEASGVAVASDSFDIANARLVFENGCTANLTASRISNKKMRKFRVFQRGAYFSLDFAEPFIEIYRLQSSDKGTSNAVELKQGGLPIYYCRPELPETNALENELDAFVSAVRDGRFLGNIALAEDGLRALETAEAIKKRCVEIGKNA